ncbi:HEAT repeat domain-containing protein [Verrucomicrobia bacterium]|nr:HEAT repeat domain-containing protein [Verrucomicrobiota bacterium]
MILSIYRTVCLIALMLAPNLSSTLVAQDDDQVEKVASLVENLGSSDERARRDAAMQLSAFAAGPLDLEDAIPALIQALGDGDPQVWFHSVTALARLGPQAAAAIPSLMEGLGSMRRGNVNVKWYRSAHALGQMGQAAVGPLLEACRHQKASVRAGAAKALEWIPEAADQTVSPLIELLGDSDQDVRDMAAHALSLLPEPSLSSLKANLEHPRPEVREVTYRALGLAGPRALDLAGALLSQLSKEQAIMPLKAGLEALALTGAPETPLLELVELLFRRDEKLLQQAVASAMLSLPVQRSAPLLIELLSDENLDVSQRAAELLGRLGPTAPEALKPLFNKIRMHLHEPEVSRFFREAYIEMGPFGIPFLLEQMKDETDIAEAHWMVQLLGAYGMIGVPTLERGLEAADSKKLRAILLAFKVMGDDSWKARFSMLELTAHPEADVRAAAIRGLSATRIKPELLSKAMDKLLVDEALEVRKAAVASLREIPEVVAGQLGKLRIFLGDRDEELRKNALLALSVVGPGASPLEGEVATLLADEKPSVRQAAITTLGALGSAPLLAVRQMHLLGMQGDADVLLTVLKSLGKLGKPASSSLPMFETSLEHANPSIRLAAFEGLVALSEPKERLLPVMIQALEDADPLIRHSSMKAMSSLRDAAAAAIPALMQRFDDSDDRNVALGVLRRLPAEIAYLDQYVLALEHANPGVRSFGCRALGRLGGAAESALPALREARRDSYRFVREQAKEAIKRIDG